MHKLFFKAVVAIISLFCALAVFGGCSPEKKTGNGEGEYKLRGEGYTLTVQGDTLKGIEYDLSGNAVSVVIPEGIRRVESSFSENLQNAVSLTVSSTVEDIVCSIVFNADDSRIVEIYDLSPHIDTDDEFLSVAAKNAKAVHTEISAESVIKRYGDGYLFYVSESEVALIGYTGNGAELTLPSMPFGRGYSIYKRAFFGNDRLRTVTFGEGISKLGMESFKGCESLNEVTMGNGLTNISESAFSGCGALGAVYIPESVAVIADGAFDHCFSLRNINVDDGNLNYADVDGVLFDKAVSKLINYPIGREAESYTIPNTVSEIGEAAFMGCKNIETVILSDGLKRIGNSCFGGCCRLGFIYLPDSVEIVENDAFIYSGVMSVRLGKGLTSLSDGAFYKCYSLVEIRNDSSIEIKNGEFGLLNLKNVYSESKGRSCIFFAEECAFFDGEELLLIHYMGKSKNITLPDTAYVGEYEVYTYAFYNSDIITINIPEGVKKLGGFAFANCSQLSKISLPSSLSEIESRAFIKCDALSEAVIADPIGWIYIFDGEKGEESVRVLSEEELRSPALAASFLKNMDNGDMVKKSG